jgi:hypothetical protein
VAERGLGPRLRRLLHGARLRVLPAEPGRACPTDQGRLPTTVRGRDGHHAAAPEGRPGLKSRSVLEGVLVRRRAAQAARCWTRGSTSARLSSEHSHAPSGGSGRQISSLQQWGRAEGADLRPGGEKQRRSSWRWPARSKRLDEQLRCFVRSGGSSGGQALRTTSGGVRHAVRVTPLHRRHRVLAQCP